MPELRWNPILKRWNIISDARQDRPVLPEDSCPLCPGVLEVPQEDYYIVSFENRFPSLEREPETPNVEGDSFYRVKKNRGVCEVLLYSSDHDASPADLSLERFEDLIRVWRDRFEKLSEEDFIDYVYIFENRGREIGVSLDHPHGQIYAFPFIPPLARRSIKSAESHYKKEEECIFCRVLTKEGSSRRELSGTTIILWRSSRSTLGSLTRFTFTQNGTFPRSKPLRIGNFLLSHRALKQFSINTGTSFR